MVTAGWYHGQGDPAGTVRYWTGEQWQGDAVVANATLTGPAATQPATTDAFHGVLAAPSAALPQVVKLTPDRVPVKYKRRGHFPILLKIMAIGSALFYAIPLASALFWHFGPGGESQVRAGLDLTGFLTPFAGILFVLFIIALWTPLSLVMLILGALWEKPGMVLGGGALWTLVAGGAVWDSWERWNIIRSGSANPVTPGYPLLYTGLLVVQLVVIIWASRLD